MAENKPEISQKPAMIQQKDDTSLPPGMKSSDFRRLEGVGTDFVRDLGPPNKSPLKSPTASLKEPHINLLEPYRVKALEVEGGKNFAALPEGTKPTDFAQPTEAGTGFVFDMTPSEKKNEIKTEKMPSTAENMPKKINALEMQDEKNMASLLQEYKPEDFQQPTEAGTGFVLDLTPPAKQEMSSKTAYQAVIDESIVAAPPIPQMLASTEKEKDKKDEKPTTLQNKDNSGNVSTTIRQSNSPLIFK